MKSWEGVFCFLIFYLDEMEEKIKINKRKWREKKRNKIKETYVKEEQTATVLLDHTWLFAWLNLLL